MPGPVLCSTNEVMPIARPRSRTGRRTAPARFPGRCRDRPRCLDRWPPWPPWRASAGPPTNCPAQAIAVGSTSAAETTWFSTSPMASASAAPTNRPVKISSLARLGLISAGSASLRRPPAPGRTPSLISGWPRVASSAAIRTSAAQRQLAATAERVAVDRGGHRLRDPGHGAEGALQYVGVLDHLGVREAPHLHDVGPGGEDALSPSQHDRGDVGTAGRTRRPVRRSAPGSRRSGH